MMKKRTLLRGSAQHWPPQNEKENHAPRFRALYLLLFFQFLIAGSVWAQSTIKGTVKDETGAGLSSVSILLKNGKASAVSDQNGNFSITVPNNNKGTLVFSHIGHAAREVALTGSTTIDIQMQVADKTLDDVVVTGYGKSSKKTITGSITSISSEDFNTGVFTSPAQLLQGKVAGLNITKSGDPSSTPAVILRGPSTLREGAAQEPFYVIDGVPGASIDLVAPDDIATIDVLKDASSTAIYGSRAANGVIQVTTKKAKNGQNRLSYSGYAATEKVSKRIEMLTGDQLRKYLADNGTGLSPANNDGANTDWQKEVQQTGFSTNHNLSYGGNNKNTTFGAGVNYFKNEGIMRRTGLDRLIFRANVEQRQFNDRLKLGLSIVNSVTNSTSIPAEVFQNMLNYLPSMNIKRPDGSYTEDFGRGSYLNPVSLVENNDIKNRSKRFMVNGVAEVKILKGLQYTLSLTSQTEENKRSAYYNNFSGIAQGRSGQAFKNDYENTKKVIESYFNYDKSFGQHNLRLLAGYSWQEDRTGDGFGVATQGFVSNELGSNNLYFSNPPAGTVAFDNTYISKLRLISYYGRVNYQYANKYLFQASIRNDGSSAFGSNNYWGYFPAVSAGWIISNEKFMEKIPAINELKLRVGYGVSGNSLGFDAYTAKLIYNVTGRYYSNGQLLNAIGPVQNENPDLKWESTGVANFGLDFSLLKNRIGGSIDVYNKKTTDLIWTYAVSATQYFVPTLTANAGKISNKGIEFVLNATPVTSKAFTWRTSFNIAHNSNNVESLSSDRFKLDSIPTAGVGGKGQSGNNQQLVKPGLPIGTFNMWHYLGKNQLGVTQIQKKDGTATTSPTTSDFMIAGNAQPKFTYGWSNSFTYKNFDLNFFFRGVVGNKILNATLAGLNSPSDAKNLNIPVFTLGESFNDNNAYLISDRFLESGSYLRMDNATLGYTIKGIKGISRLHFYVSANNLFIITDYRGIDPEINIGGLTPGIDNNNYYPKTKSFIFGVNVLF